MLFAQQCIYCGTQHTEKADLHLVVYFLSSFGGPPSASAAPPARPPTPTSRRETNRLSADSPFAIHETAQMTQSPPAGTVECCLACAQCRMHPPVGVAIPPINLSFPLSMLNHALLLEFYAHHKILHTPPHHCARLCFGTEVTPSTFLEQARVYFHQQQQQPPQPPVDQTAAPTPPQPPPQPQQQQRHTGALETHRARVQAESLQPWMQSTQRAAYGSPSPAAAPGAVTTTGAGEPVPAPPTPPMPHELGVLPPAHPPTPATAPIITPTANPKQLSPPSRRHHHRHHPAAHQPPATACPVHRHPSTGRHARRGTRAPPALPALAEVVSSPTMFQGPLPTSNWVIPGRLLCGSFPGAASEPQHSHALGAILDAEQRASLLRPPGVDTFVNLATLSEVRDQAWRIRPYFEQAQRLLVEDREAHRRATAVYEQHISRQRILREQQQRAAAAANEARPSTPRSVASASSAATSRLSRPSLTRHPLRSSPRPASAHGRTDAATGPATHRERRTSVSPSPRMPPQPVAASAAALAVDPAPVAPPRFRQEPTDLRLIEFPIPDGAVAGDREVMALVDQLCVLIQRGRCLYVHGLEGHGRPGTVCALVLCRLYGVASSEALTRVQRSHGCRLLGGELPSPTMHVQKLQVYRVATLWERAKAAPVAGPGVVGPPPGH
ncbi:hypothetical protein PAPYR_1707 [Paratrimastix pyriformis]|uniref:Tyrosine-protein phosphatase domain-containing protein n=1 Tax=Paratrimastix pyriformis TaxID=342808 RepID=A0ABQ8USV6_9EUKA|nr:hypothetical protein PAPYR_1707 [Paratrimastix pyriformis]